jgi:tRNA(adenine34) deaminase
MDGIRSLMDAALEQARAALATDDVPIGAVVAGPDGRILAVGRNEREATGDPTAHAEVVALRAAAAALGTWRLDGCTLVVTLEPCVMCAGAAMQARVARVAFGAWDEKAGALGGIIDVVRDRPMPHRVEVISGVREAECSALLSEFFSSKR